MFSFPGSGYVWPVSIAELAQPRFPLMQTKLTAALLMGLSGALACLSSPPAKAGPNPPLVNCVNGTLNTFLNTGCTRGDKNFLFNVYTGNLPSNQVNVLISGSGNSYTVNITPDSFWSGAGSIGYTVEVNNTSTDLLASLSGAQSTSQPNSGPPADPWSWNGLPRQPQAAQQDQIPRLKRAACRRRKPLVPRMGPNDPAGKSFSSSARTFGVLIQEFSQQPLPG
jgi:hypothetical protein